MAVLKPQQGRSAKVDVVLGLQWGDEGKGKLVDLLAGEMDVVARYQGGPNAGHTIVHGDRKFVLHLLPSGILSQHVESFIGNGVVIDPNRIREEMEKLAEADIDARLRLRIALNAHVILPHHLRLDAQAESRPGAFGTTRRGIGYAYGDKALRWGVRIADFLADDWRERIRGNAAKHAERNAITDSELDQELGTLEQAHDLLKSLAVDGPAWIHQRLTAGKRVLAEGAQGVMLDIDHGTYPFVTSSNTITGGVCTGLGVPPSAIGEVWGVAKAYCTRVGEGAFPSELTDAVGDELRRAGAEFGSTTGRPRRCGWLDSAALRRAVMLTGATRLAIMKLDVLDGFDEIAVVTEYDSETFPQTADDFAAVRPKLEVLPGWKASTAEVRRWANLPAAAQRYLERVEELIGVPISLVSTGPDREQTIRRDR